MCTHAHTCSHITYKFMDGYIYIYIRVSTQVSSFPSTPPKQQKHKKQHKETRSPAARGWGSWPTSFSQSCRLQPRPKGNRASFQAWLILKKPKAAPQTVCKIRVGAQATPQTSGSYKAGFLEPSLSRVFINQGVGSSCFVVLLGPHRLPEVESHRVAGV